MGPSTDPLKVLRPIMNKESAVAIQQFLELGCEKSHEASLGEIGANPQLTFMLRLGCGVPAPGRRNRFGAGTEEAPFQRHPAALDWLNLHYHACHAFISLRVWRWGMDCDCTCVSKLLLYLPCYPKRCPTVIPQLSLL